MPEEVKESRSAVLGIRVTERERLEANFVAGARGTNVSDLLRSLSLDAVLAEAERIRAVLQAA